MSDKDTTAAHNEAVIYRRAEFRPNLLDAVGNTLLLLVMGVVGLVSCAARAEDWFARVCERHSRSRRRPRFYPPA